jgi:hypothetical protein
MALLRPTFSDGRRPVGRINNKSLGSTRASRRASPRRPENTGPSGCDGMTVRCWFRWGNRKVATDSWQDDEPATFQLARAVHRLATEVLREPTRLEALREIGVCKT